ncbi:MAG: hypothetical protein V1865_00405 [bacterium]
MSDQGRKILLGLTSFETSNWRDKINELVQFNITEISLLPNYLNQTERRELYEMLKQTPVKSIPHVNLAVDAEEWELDYLVQNYGTKIFTSPSTKEGYKMMTSMPKYNSMIYMENGEDYNNNKFFNDTLFDKYQVHGISLDLAHLENERHLSKPSYKQTIMMLEKYPIGCNQVRGINRNSISKLFKKPIHDHYLKSLEQLDYLREHPKNYFSPFIIIELSNSLMEQQEIRKYMDEVLL